MFFYDRGVTQNYTEALTWFRKSAEQEYDLAQYILSYTIRVSSDEKNN